MTRVKQDNTNTRPVIADLIRNLEGRQGDTGEQDKPTDRIPSPLMGEGWGEGDSMMTTARHTGLDPVSTRWEISLRQLELGVLGYMIRKLKRYAILRISSLDMIPLTSSVVWLKRPVHLVLSHLMRFRIYDDSHI